MLKSVVSRLRLQTQTPGVAVTAWSNDDIRPLPPSCRQWTTSTYFGWWTIWMMGLSNFQVGSSMVAVGLSVWQAMIAVSLGRIIIALTAVLNGYPGAEWHIGFPVFSRIIWGMRGSYIVIVLRVLMGLVGFAVQSWNGGLCVSVILSAMFSSYYHMPNMFPASSNLTTSQLVGWLTFLFICALIMYVHPQRAPKLMAVMNILTLITLISIVIWSLAAAKGTGPLLSRSGTLSEGSQLGWAILGGINNVIGTVTPALMSQSDFSRFAKRPRDQVWGQCIAFVFVGTVMPLFGCLVSSATQKIYGQPIWNPPVLLTTWLKNGYDAQTRAAAIFAGLGLGISQLAVVIVDNAYAVGIDFSGLFPVFLNIRRGSYFGLVMSMALCPWELLSTASVFLTVISSFSAFFGPICGMHVCDYFLIRRRRIKLSDLYVAKPGTIYYYFNGWNWRALASWLIGWIPFFPGLLHTIQPRIAVSYGVANLYNIAFIFGFCVSFIVHFTLNTLFPPLGLSEIDVFDEFGTFTTEEALNMGVEVEPTMSENSAGVDRGGYSSDTEV